MSIIPGTHSCLLRMACFTRQLPVVDSTNCNIDCPGTSQLVQQYAHLVSGFPGCLLSVLCRLLGLHEAVCPCQQLSQPRRSRVQIQSCNRLMQDKVGQHHRWAMQYAKALLCSLGRCTNASEQKATCSAADLAVSTVASSAEDVVCLVCGTRCTWSKPSANDVRGSKAVQDVQHCRALLEMYW